MFFKIVMDISAPCTDIILVSNSKRDTFALVLAAPTTECIFI